MKDLSKKRLEILELIGKSDNGISQSDIVKYTMKKLKYTSKDSARAAVSYVLTELLKKKLIKLKERVECERGLKSNVWIKNV